jgi:hypothetical protein
MSVSVIVPDDLLGFRGAEALASALEDVVDERMRQIDKGYDSLHDDTHDLPEYSQMITDRLHHVTFLTQEPRKNLVEIAALATAAIEKLDRAAARAPS